MEGCFPLGNWNSLSRSTRPVEARWVSIVLLLAPYHPSRSPNPAPTQRASLTTPPSFQHTTPEFQPLLPPRLSPSAPHYPACVLALPVHLLHALRRAAPPFSFLCGSGMRGRGTWGPGRANARRTHRARSDTKHDKCRGWVELAGPGYSCGKQVQTEGGSGSEASGGQGAGGAPANCLCGLRAVVSGAGRGVRLLAPRRMPSVSTQGLIPRGRRRVSASLPAIFGRASVEAHCTVYIQTARYSIR
ncbi:hypothetical protein FB45DRAFT_320194 [Roridomyces roridus]|uniref:Uncharacterized protein n=1 Tax=Roridomyces roridus TaxID=1738132 RepID=A0AAD7B637_9AGAR|nr:hypothetical protein FB45DRAFT_320194 [Roridomyces roridus]